jgi:hypothetical protein
MKSINKVFLPRNGMVLALAMIALTACDRTSSPEGRMTIKIENLQKEMRDNMAHQNGAILDSLRQIRQELNALRQQRK